jgi:aspartate aminotransferase
MLSSCAGARARTANFGRTSRRELIDLTTKEILARPPDEVRAGAIAAIEQGINHSTDVIGIEPLRKAIARRLAMATGLIWRTDEVAVTAGAKPALFNAALAILNPGDEVLIPCPYWSTFASHVVLAGAKPIFVKLDARDDYRPRIERLEQTLTSATRAIVVNTPGNPTGAILDGELLRAIADFAVRNGLWIIFDECDSAFVFEPSRHHHILSVNPAARSCTLIVNSFSTSLALAGWRLGYVAGPQDVIAAVRAVQDQTMSSPNVITQHGVLAYLRCHDDHFEQAMRTSLGFNRAQGLDAFSRLMCTPLPVAQGGCSYYLDLSDLLAQVGQRNGICSAGDLARFLSEEAGVAVATGSEFGDHNGIRISYSVDPGVLRRGLERLIDALNDLMSSHQPGSH